MGNNMKIRVGDLYYDDSCEMLDLVLDIEQGEPLILDLYAYFERGDTGLYGNVDGIYLGNVEKSLLKLLLNDVDFV